MYNKLKTTSLRKKCDTSEATMDKCSHKLWEEMGSELIFLEIKTVTIYQVLRCML